MGSVIATVSGKSEMALRAAKQHGQSHGVRRGAGSQPESAEGSPVIHAAAYPPGLSGFCIRG